MGSVRVTNNLNHNLMLMVSVRGGLERFAEALSITPDEVAELDKDIATLKYLENFSRRVEDRKSAYFAFRDAMVFGKSPERPPRPAFDVFDLPEEQEARPGILTRFRLLLRKIRASANFDAQASAALGLTGADSTDVGDPLFRPSVSVDALVDNRIEVRWKKGKFTGAEVYWRLNDSSPWIRVGPFTRSPARLKAPVPIGQVAVVEVRIRMLKGNDPVSGYSQIARVVTNGE